MSGQPDSPSVPVPRWTLREARAIIVGGAVAVVIALILAYSHAGNQVKAAGDPYTLKAKFNRIDGLVDGADVLFSGIKVGIVSGQTLDENYRAVVVLKLDSGVKLPTDTAAAIHTDGLFGSKFVVLDPGGDVDILEAGDEITFTQDAMIVSELLDLIISEGKALRKTDGGVSVGNGDKGDD